MQHSNIDYQIENFVARQDGWQYKVYATIFSVILIILLVYVFSQSVTIDKSLLSPIALFTFTSAYLWYKILDKGIKLTINNNGIKFKRRRIIPWETIQGFHFRGRHHKVSSCWLFIETTQHNRTIRIKVSDLDKTYHHIAKAIKQYSADYNIEYGGITNDVP